MKKISEQITVISEEEAELLKADKFSRESTGLFLVCPPEKNTYRALDYKERLSWIDFFGKVDHAPRGYEKEFNNPLEAIDWLLQL